MHTAGGWWIRRFLVAVPSLAVMVLSLLIVSVGPAQANGSEGGAGNHRVARPSAATASVTGPVTGGKGAVVLAATTFNLSQVGYEQSEFFLSGTASAYSPVSSLGSDGKWSVAPVVPPNGRYATRIVVNRPQDPRRFNGTILVEWLNVSGGLDAGPDWISAHTEMIRDGFAWVGVSAQALGLNATKAADPLRYASLTHPGDSYSYDIFSQAGQAVWDSAAQILGGLRPHSVLATGESQSAFRLTTYIDAIHPLVNVFDGFLVHSRSGGSSALSQAPQAAVPTPAVVFFRTDLRVPVLTFETETDLLGLGYFPAQQDDFSRFRLWEVAGTAHADTYGLGIGFSDTGNGEADIAAFDSMLNPPTSPIPNFPLTCGSPINSGEQHYVLDAAVYALNRWVRTGDAPSRAPRLQINPGPPATFVLDSNGNVKGGIRTPAVDVPIATLSGLGQTGSSFCFLFGTTVPFTPTALARLYPAHLRFVLKWARDTGEGVEDGFIRPADAVKLVAAAAAKSNVGG